MKKIVQMALFMSVFFIGFLILNYIIFSRIGFLLDLSSITVYSLIFIFAVSYPATAVLERAISHMITRTLYAIASAWMGISFFILILLIAYEILNFIFNIPPFIAGISIIGLAIIIGAYAIINGLYLEIKEVEISIPNLKRDMEIVQLSDMHIGSIRNSGFIKKVVKKTNTLNPDMVLITGDTADGSAKLHPHMFDSIENIKCPIFLGMGNHDFYEGIENVHRVLKTTNITVLRDELVEFGDLQIIGADYSIERNHLKKILHKIRIDKSRPSILMYHVPTEVEAANEAGISLQISGHTHKGQFFPFSILGRLVFPYFNGLYDYNGTQLYVSQGTGTWGPPMRLGTRNEITFIKLKKLK